MAAAWMRAVAALTACAILVAGLPACVSMETVAVRTDPGPEATLVFDLVGVGAREGERADGVRVRVRRLETGQDMYVLTERAGPTRVEHLPPGRFAIRIEGARIGGPDCEGTLTLRSGDIVHVMIHDGTKTFEKGAEAVVTGIGYFVVGTVLVALCVGILWLSIGAPGLEADRDHNGHRGRY